MTVPFVVPSLGRLRSVLTTGTMPRRLPGGSVSSSGVVVAKFGW